MILTALLDRLRGKAASKPLLPPPAPATPAIVTAEAPTGHRTLRAGMSGPDVAELQRAVGSIGEDGTFGPGTTGALIAWQLEHGLLADGIAGPATWRAIGIAPAAPPVFVAPPVPTGELGGMVQRVLAGMHCYDPTGWAGVLVPHMQAQGIVAPLDLVGFFANTIHETGGYRLLSEDLHYTTAASICRTWPSRFPAYESAQPFVRDAYALAEHVYGGRMGNRPAGSGDGFNFRGAGCYQTTGANNMRLLVPILGVPLEQVPDLLREREGAARSACIFWRHNGFSTLAARRDWVTLRIRGNGGTVGMPQVMELTREIIDIVDA